MPSSFSGPPVTSVVNYPDGVDIGDTRILWGEIDQSDSADGGSKTFVRDFASPPILSLIHI